MSWVLQTGRDFSNGGGGARIEGLRGHTSGVQIGTSVGSVHTACGRPSKQVQVHVDCAKAGAQKIPSKVAAITILRIG
jgi:hypothetical protein